MLVNCQSGGVSRHSRRMNSRVHSPLIEKAPTLRRSAQTNNLLFLQGKLVVISDFFSHTNWLLRIDDNLLLALHSNHFRVAIRLRDNRYG